MGASVSTDAAASANSNNNSAAQQNQLETLSEEQFKETVRAAANKFKNLVKENKVMLFSATYCSYCTVAKVRKYFLNSIFKKRFNIYLPVASLMDCPLKRTLDDMGTKYGAYEVNREEDGEVMMNIVSAVSGNRMVSQIPGPSIPDLCIRPFF
jgi:hypothetical protein